MNYTENYHLPQWVETDRIMRTDFNQMCADIDSGINTAQETAEDAKSEALKLPYVVGSYTGNDAETRDFNLGFRPRFVIICSQMQKFSGTSSGGGRGVLMAGPTPGLVQISLTDNGFRFTKDSFYPYPDVNRSDYNYDYIAFR